MNSEFGLGDIVSHRIQQDGRVRLRVLGKDERTGKFAAFVITVSWTYWNLINESLYNEREEIAQSRIPY